jgi:transposase
MARPSKYPRELRERAVRMVFESKDDYPSEFEAIRMISSKLGIGSSETLRKWVRRAEVDGGTRPGKTSSELAEIRELKRENAELRRANEILKAASAFFAAELDRPPRY